MTELRFLPVVLPVLLVACAAPPDEDPKPAGSEATGQSMLETEPAACSLQRSGIKFPTEACTSCMQTACCAETTGCFGPAAGACRTLHACLLGCPSGSMIVAGSGEVGRNPCIEACEAANAAAIPSHDRYDACIRDKCMPACGS